MASFDPRNPVIKSRYGLPEIIPAATEAGSTSFEAGELVYYAASALVTVATASSLIAGVALVDSTSASPGTAAVPVQLILPDDEVQIRVASDTSGTLALASTLDVGNDYAIDVTSNLCFIDSSDTTGGQFIFVAPINDSAGTSTYWGRFKLAESKGFVKHVG
jgi:hypothetical protein